MNPNMDTTAEAETKTLPAFPLPYSNEEPEETMRRALSLIMMVQEALDKPHPLSFCHMADIEATLSAATTELKPVMIYLETDDRPDTLDRYRDARRRDIMSYGGSE